MFGSALPTLIVFPEERPVFVREYSTNHYSVLSYFVSRLMLEAYLTAIQILLLSLFTKFLLDVFDSFRFGHVLNRYCHGHWIVGRRPTGTIAD